MSVNQHHPLVSICIPTYRRLEFIKDALDGCLSQTYGNYEIIVHDDTEDDGIRDIVQSYNSEKITYIKNVPPLGLVGKLNNFLDICRGEWMVVLCDDDRFDREYLSALLSMARKYPDAALLCSRFRTIDRYGAEIALDRERPVVSRPDEFLRDVFLPEKENFKMNVTGLMFRPGQLKALGGFADMYRGYHTDRIAWAMLGAEGPVVCEPTTLCSLRVHGGAISSSIGRDIREAIKSDLKMRDMIGNLLETKLAQAATSEEIENLAAARENFGKYMSRSLSHSFDHGFQIALAEPNPANRPYTAGQLFDLMKQLDVRPFRSAWFYRLIAFLPGALRLKTITWLQQFKRRHLH